jgi:G:T-mismatch repair DNA endonuclease (very short patch repair protein)
MHLKSTQALSVVLSAAADVDAHAAWTNLDSGVAVPDSKNLALSTSPQEIIAEPSSGVHRPMYFSARNRDTTDTTDVTVTITDSTGDPDVEVYKATLLPGEELVYTHGHGWFVHEAAGGIVQQLAKFWVKAAGDGSAIRDSYNVTSLTDTGAGQLTVTIATDFGSTSWVCNATVERNSTSMSVTNTKTCAIRQSTQTAGAVQIEVWDQTSSTAVLEDPAEYHVIGHGDQ